VRPGWIGVRIKPLDEPVDGSTAGIEEILPDAPGQKAGLQAGDVIVQVGDRRVACPEDVLDASFFLTANDETLIRVARDGSERDFNVTPETPPAPAVEANPEVAEPPVPSPVKGDR
jgi:serine protease Do